MQQFSELTLLGLSLYYRYTLVVHPNLFKQKKKKNIYPSLYLCK